MSDDQARLEPSENEPPKDKQFAEAGLSSVLLNTCTSMLYAQGAAGEMDFSEALSVVIAKAKRVQANNTSELEATLAAQVGSLDAIFTEMARRAALSFGGNLQATESYMRMALKAQSQCARTIEVLANLKNPPVVYAKQANITSGPQQVNNGVQGNPHAHVEKVENQQNELLSGNLNETMDIRGAATPSPVNQTVEAVGAKHRRKDRRR